MFISVPSSYMLISAFIINWIIHALIFDQIVGLSCYNVHAKTQCNGHYQGGVELLVSVSVGVCCSLNFKFI